MQSETCTPESDSPEKEGVHSSLYAIEEPFQQRDATEDEIETLPHIRDKLPFVAWVVIIAGAAERFTYFGLMAPWRKFFLSK